MGFCLARSQTQPDSSGERLSTVPRPLAQKTGSAKGSCVVQVYRSACRRAMIKRNTPQRKARCPEDSNQCRQSLLTGFPDVVGRSAKTMLRLRPFVRIGLHFPQCAQCCKRLKRPVKRRGQQGPYSAALSRACESCGRGGQISAEQQSQKHKRLHPTGGQATPDRP